jgi:hypothetical protein
MRWFPLWFSFFLVIFIMVAYDIVNQCRREGFSSKDYVAVTAEKPPRNNCLSLLVQKKWISPKDKKRANIASDMQIARAIQPLYSSYVYPNIESCVLPESMFDLYRNNKGQNSIDAETCVIKGKTVDGDLIYYGLEKVGPSSEIHPKGCMFDFSRSTGKDDLLRFLDDMYKIKHYPYEKEKREYDALLNKHNLPNK